MNNLKVTILIPIYNGDKYLREAIDSALNQTYKNIEVIVINDGSTDNTDKLVKRYGKKVKYYKKKNGGVSTALNLGLSKSTGDYIAWLPHDDIYTPNKIEVQMNYLTENDLLNEKVITYTDFEAIDSKSKHLWYEEKDHNELVKKPEYGLLRGGINGITLLIPKKAFKDHGTFDEKLRCVQDYDLWFKMMKTYKFVHIPKVLAKSRFHPQQVTNKNGLVICEGNALWINMIENIPDKRKIELEGSLYAFYDKMIKFLKTSDYNEAKDYCINQISKIKIGTKELEYISKLNEIPEKSTFFQRISKIKKSIKINGYKKTMKKIIDKIKR